MPTDTQHSHTNEEQQMDAAVIQASGPPAKSLAYRSEPVPVPGPGAAREQRRGLPDGARRVGRN
jgi:hypothetical protein